MTFLPSLTLLLSKQSSLSSDYVHFLAEIPFLKFKLSFIITKFNSISSQLFFENYYSKIIRNRKNTRSCYRSTERYLTYGRFQSRFFFTRPRGWHENYYCENSFLFFCTFFRNFSFNSLVSAIVSGDAVRLCDSNWNSKPKNHKKKLSGRELLWKGWLWACVYVNARTRKRAKLGWKGRSLRNRSEGMERVINQIIFFGVSHHRKTKQKCHKHNQTLEISQPVKCYCKIISYVRPCVCQATKLRIPEKAKILSGWERIKMPFARLGDRWENKKMLRWFDSRDGVGRNLKKNLRVENLMVNKRKKRKIIKTISC